ncbi:WAT1-related protein At1g44800-like [Phalaenopsis equestris]|uniref:WAT1-related protein At1g44800-like n=1 Tax=Phalaenopsis equestris TaxID=78828 RepID=UPI0009E22506|nr:WAT1-related protein At1g44800-like [Phalaenopsis equestris]
MYQKVKPYAAMVLQQLSFAGMSIVFLAVLKNGMSQTVLFAYRNIVAAIFIAPFALYFERGRRPRMTRHIFMKITALGLLQGVLDQNLLFMGAKLTSAGYASALKNLIPPITFVLSLALRVEKLNIYQRHGKAKVIGILLALAGSLLMVLYKGPAAEFPRYKGREHHSAVNSNGNDKEGLNWIMGTLMIITSSTSWCIFLILQSNTLKSYEAKFSLTTLICSMGAVMNTVLALVLEHGSQSWIIKWDMRLFAIIYSGVVCTGVTNYLLELVLKDKGPVFAGAFTPLCMIVTAVLGSIILAEKIHLGMIIGAIIITAGLYSLLWGKSKDYTTQSEDDQSRDYFLNTDLSMAEHSITKQNSIPIDHDTTKEKSMTMP